MSRFEFSMPAVPELFLDQSLGRKKLATAHRADGWGVITLSEIYGVRRGQHVPDTTWIREQTLAGRILLTSDARILSDPLERAALEFSNALLFAFPTARLRSEDHYRRLSVHRHRIAEIAALREVPAAYVLYESRVSRVLP